MGDGILCQYGKSVGCDQFRDTVVDLRVYMVWTTGEYDTAAVVFFHPFDSFFAFFADVISFGFLFFPCSMSSSFDLCMWNLEFFAEFFHQTLCQHFFIGKCHKRIQETNLTGCDLIYVIFDILCIRGNDRAVVMVACIRELRSLIWDTWIEDRVDAFFDQPCNMSMGKFRRITFGLTWDRFDTQLVDLTGGSRREYQSELQLFEEGCPERIVFIDVQDTRHTDGSTGGIFFFQWFVIEHTLIFIFKQIRDLLFVFLFAQCFFAAVSGYVTTVAGEFVDGQQTVVGTSATAGKLGVVFQVDDLINGKHGCLFAFFVTVSCDKCSTECTHDTCDIRADRLTAGDCLEASKNCIVVERTALYNDMLAKFCRVRQLDNFKQRIFDNGVSKSGGDICYGSAFFLRLFYFGVHKYGTTGSKVNRMLRKKSLFCKVLYTVI